MIRLLPEDKFMRTHRSYAVNRSRVDSVAHNKTQRARVTKYP